MNLISKSRALAAFAVALIGVAAIGTVRFLRVPETVCGAMGRGPASLVCGDVFSNRAPLTNPIKREEVEAFLKRFYERTEFSKEELKIYTENQISANDINLSLILKRRLDQGDPTVKSMIELFKYKVDGEKVTPPESILELYLDITKAIIASAEKAGLKEDELVLPGFLLRNDAGRLITVRPGMDPIPEGNWKPPGNAQVSAAQFSGFIAEGKMIFTPNMFFHDVGHFLDSVFTPEYMRAYRSFSREKVRLMSLRGEVEPTKRWKFLEKMELFFNEFLYLPNYRNAQEIRKFFSRDPEVAGRITRDEARAKYLALPDEKVLSIAQAIVKSPYSFFQVHGGGSRDWSYERFVEVERDFATIWGAVENYGKDLPTVSKATEKTYLLDDIPGLFHQVQLSVDILSGKSLAEVDDRYVYFSQHKDQSRADTLAGLRVRLADLEFKLINGLTVPLSPDQVARDIRPLLDEAKPSAYSSSATYQYFSATTTPDSAVRAIWLNPLMLPQ